MTLMLKKNRNSSHFNFHVSLTRLLLSQRREIIHAKLENKGHLVSYTQKIIRVFLRGGIYDLYELNKQIRCFFKFIILFFILKVTSYLVANIPKYDDGTIKFRHSSYDTSVVIYDIHHYVQRRSKIVGKWIRDRDDVGVDFNDVVSDVRTKPSFYLDDVVMRLRNGSVVSTHAFCSVRCVDVYIYFCPFGEGPMGPSYSWKLYIW